MMRRKRRGFTLIELLTVIAIVGILAAILIPVVGAAKQSANVAASKAQLLQYVNAIERFKSEYGFYPFVSGSGESAEFVLNTTAQTEEFVATLSGRGLGGERVSINGNRRQISFYAFPQSDFIDGGNRGQIVDRFGNADINVVIDTDGDGIVEPEGPGDNEGAIRVSVTAYVNANPELGAPAYKLWE